MPDYHIGVLSLNKTQKRPDPSFKTGWIESCEPEGIWFDSRQLKNRSFYKDIDDHVYLYFSIKHNAERSRPEAVDCEVLKEEDLADRFFTVAHSCQLSLALKLSERIILKIKQKIETDLDLERDDRRRHRLEQLLMTIGKSLEPIEINYSNRPEKPITNGVPSILGSLFQANDQAYNENLFYTLLRGIPEIVDQQVYEQSADLFKFNRHFSIIDPNELGALLYQKANQNFRFQLWLDGMISFCDTEILKQKLKLSDVQQRSQIENRLGDLLPVTSSERQNLGVTRAMFRGIRRLLIKEIQKAESHIMVAVAWFTNAELFAALRQKLEEGIRVELILINDYINNWEDGLDFQRFVDRGGKLYFSEYPQVMHHKFCIIDEHTLVNGSYNWTYYAEDRNDENIVLFKHQPPMISSFSDEFDRLKKILGQPVTVVQRFDPSKLVSQDWFSARHYLSRDLGLKARRVLKVGNVLEADRIAERALRFNDDENIRHFRQEIEADVELSNRTELAAKILKEQPKGDAAVEPVQPLADLREPKTPQQDKAIEQDETSAETKPASKNEPPAARTVVQQDHFALNTSALPVLAEEKLAVKAVPPPNAAQPSITIAPPIPPQQGTQALPGTFRQNDIPKLNGPTAAPPLTNNRSTSASTSPSSAYGGSIDTARDLFNKIKVVLVLDISVSMAELYNKGAMQQLLERNFSAALSIAQHDEMAVYVFDTVSYRLEPATRSNYKSYIDTHLLTKHKISGNTIIVSAVNALYQDYFENQPPSGNVLALIFTDGEDSKMNELKIKIQASSRSPVFWQFVGIGAKFPMLEAAIKDPANIGNTGFFVADNISAIGDEKLFTQLLLPFREWYKQADQGGIILK